MTNNPPRRPAVALRTQREPSTSSAVDRARELRREATQPEHLLWHRLRHRQLGGFRFRRQQPIGDYIADFCCFEKRLIVELDGRLHSTETADSSDRSGRLESYGFTVLLFRNNDVLRDPDAVGTTILDALEA